VNGIVAFRLFRTEYLNYPGSIEGAFVALARYIQAHHPMYGWLPIWFQGLPFSFVYQPALHYAVAWTSSLTGRSPAGAYHAVTAITYSLGPVAVFFLLKRLCAYRGGLNSMGFAFAGAMLYSLFSPVLLLVPVIKVDVGGLLHARRLQALVTYGEGPNVTGLTLVPLALFLLDRWFATRTRAAFVMAAMGIAAVLITSWPSSVVLALAMVCYAAASDIADLPRSTGRIAMAGVIGYAIASPFALPSMIWQTYTNANVMGDSPVRNTKYYVSCVLLLLALLATRAILFRAGRAIRFAVLWTVLLGWIVLGAAWFHVAIVPQALRFHLALEIALIILVVLTAQRVLRTHRSQIVAATVLAAFCCLQLYQYRSYARSVVRRFDVTRSIEWQTADWLAKNMPAGRVFAPGSISFWMNAFTDNPQIIGCCDQSIINPQNWIAAYILGAGYGDEAEDEEISLLWLKSYGAQAVIAGGPASREYYKPYTHPKKFDGRLNVLWASGDDKIYQIPWRGDPLVRIVPVQDAVRHPPYNGIDIAEMRRFVAALDNPALPVASVNWDSPQRGRFRANMTPDQVVSVAINWHRGWSAQVGGRPIPVMRDGLGFILLAPACAGDCDIQLDWSPGREVSAAVAASCIVLALLASWVAFPRAKKSK
jgi:hypothetical protein